MQQMLLFICTGNYYRSRFAEAIFNHHAQLRHLPWRAFSRGLAIDQVEGDLSPFTFHALMDRGIDLNLTGSIRTQLGIDDLVNAHLVIALKETEHRPLMSNLFPFWTNRIQYWEEHDLDVAPPEVALPQIELKVLSLVEQLAAEISGPALLAPNPQTAPTLAVELPALGPDPALQESPTQTRKLAGKRPSEIRRPE